MMTMAKKKNRKTRKRRTGLSAKKLRAIKTYANKGYSANRIQKRMRQRHMGVRRKTILRVVRETKGRPQRAHPEKYVRRKYRRPVQIHYPSSFLPKQVRLIGTQKGEPKVVRKEDSGRNLYLWIKNQIVSGEWDRKPIIES